MCVNVVYFLVGMGIIYMIVVVVLLNIKLSSKVERYIVNFL